MNRYTPRLLTKAREREGAKLRLEEAAIALKRAVATADYEIRKREVVRLALKLAEACV